MWVGLFHGKPQEVTPSVPEGDVGENYQWVEVTDAMSFYVNTDYILEKGKVIPPSKEYFINQIKADLTENRRNYQNYYIKYENNEYWTDDNTHAVITNHIISAQLNENPDKYSVNFKSKTGNVLLKLKDLVKIKQLITEHVQTCFNREAEIIKEIDGKISKLKDYEAILKAYADEICNGWPVPDIKDADRTDVVEATDEE